eukprot:JP446392.1.p2 GENE.JP446392.1~~JP446392.1.p2  ORF type:complete len:367 (-),score=183.63 JP446392.1:44-1144(-)
MKVCVAIVLAAVAVSVLALPVSQEFSFESFVAQYERTYTGAEYEARKAIFENNVRKIAAHNAQGASFELGITKFADMTPTELNSNLGYNKGMARSMLRSANFRNASMDISSLPESVDWRTKGAVTAVKDQGMCGSCWAFSAAASIESHYAVATGVLPEPFSTQQITSCTPNPEHCGGDGGCSGATAQLAFKDIMAQGGITTEANYKYTSGKTSKTGTCAYDKSSAVAHVTGFQNIEENSYEALMEAIATVGPVSVSVDASKWFMYKGGIFDGCNQVNPDINHAVQLVGYGSEMQNGEEKPYWIVRNSWGSKWGEGGFIRLKRSAKPECGQDITPAHGSACEGGPSEVTVCGTCGILYDNSYPIVSA